MIDAALDRRLVTCEPLGISRRFFACLCLFLATACAGSPAEPTSPLNAEFTLAPGETMSIDDTSVTIRFDGVSGDSRCPADALCVTGGSASVQITVSATM